jgi:hypothetical protein
MAESGQEPEDHAEAQTNEREKPPMPPLQKAKTR